MKNLYLVTGAAGHVGSTIVRKLLARGETVRCLVLPEEPGTDGPNVCYVRGDVRDRASLLPLFENAQGADLIVLHAAGIVSIADRVTDLLYDVNVNGTRNILSLCETYRVKKLVYVSSVHALPEREDLRVITETDDFSADKVVGGYAKTKAEATRLALEAAKRGLNVTVVHPSGILGPYDAQGNHLVQFVADYVAGRLPAGVRGGYDLVDVRDVADGCLAAAERGPRGACYILSNRHYEVRDLLRMMRAITGARRVPVLPLWVAKAAAPLLQWVAKKRRKRPLYTRYSLYTLQTNDRFSHDKATRELGFMPRDLYETLKDTIEWVSSPRPGRKRASRLRAARSRA